MKIISVIAKTHSYTVGRLSDGSDKQIIVENKFHVTIYDNGKYEALLNFDDLQFIKDSYENGEFTLVELSQREIQNQALLNMEYLVVMSELTNL